MGGLAVSGSHGEERVPRFILVPNSLNKAMLVTDCTLSQPRVSQLGSRPTRAEAGLS